MSLSVASLDHDVAVDSSPLVKGPAADALPTAAAMPPHEESIARAGEDISSLLVLIPVGLLALATFGAMLTPL